MLGLSITGLPPYLNGAIAAFRSGQTGRDLHLGYWADPPGLDTACSAAEFQAAQAELTRRVLALAEIRPSARVLDVACGLGGLLAGLGKGLDLLGLNLDPRQLALCRGVPARFVAADACALPFPDASFDAVFCVEAMFHFKSRSVFLAEAARVLRPGGVIVLTDILARPPGHAPWPLAVMEDAIRRDYGPWSQIWTGRPTHPGLRATWHDWTAQTLPSHRFTARGGALPRQPGAGDVLRWLHAKGHLTYAAAMLHHG